MIIIQTLIRKNLYYSTYKSNFYFIKKVKDLNKKCNKPMKHIYILLIPIFFFILSCNENEAETEKTVIAKVYDNYLYLEDFKELAIEGMTAKDSAVIVKNKIDLWVKKQLMLNKAELNLSEKQKDVEKNVADYRASLLIYRYKQEFIKEKLDTNVTDNQVETYYKNNVNSFVMNGEAVKALFIKIPKNSNNIYEFKKVFFSKEEAPKDLLIYCKENIKSYSNFNNDWVFFFEISNMLPLKIAKPEIILKANDYIQTQDDDYYYFIKIYEYRLKGQKKPLKFVKEQIKSVILNKRKIEIVEELENTIYNNAVDNKNVKITAK